MVFIGLRGLSSVVILIVLNVLSVLGGDYRSNSGFLPSTFQHRNNAPDLLAEASTRSDHAAEVSAQAPAPAPAPSRADRGLEANDLGSDGSDRTQRFGVTGFGTTGYPTGSSPGLYNPVKIDLGGVLLGAIIGFGSVLILPKLIHAVSYGYGGGYGRSLEPDLSSVMSRMEETLERYDIDAESCVARAACYQARRAHDHLGAGNASDADVLLATLTNNSLVKRMIGGTTILDAVTIGTLEDIDCIDKYPRCKLDKNTIIKMLTQILPS